MTEGLTNESLKNTLGLAVSVIATEHFMSAGLSSPWSTAKFAISDQDKQEVWHYFNEAVSASLVFSAITAYMLKSVYPLVSSGATLLYYKKLYSDALSRTPVKNPTPVLAPKDPLPPTLDENGNYVPLTDEYLMNLKSYVNNLVSK